MHKHIEMRDTGYEAPHAELRSDVALRLPKGYRLKIGAVPVGSVGRQVHNGPMVAGPWAFTFGLCLVIDNDPARRAANAAEYATDVCVNDGDTLSIDGHTYRVRIVRSEFVELVKL